MTSPEKDAVIALIEDAQVATSRAFISALPAFGGLNDTVSALAEAANLLIDARVMADNYGLRRVHTVTSDADKYRHATQSAGRAITAFRTLCGAALDAESTHASPRRAPTCPKCIAMLTGKESQDV